MCLLGELSEDKHICILTPPAFFLLQETSWQLELITPSSEEMGKLISPKQWSHHITPSIAHKQPPPCLWRCQSPFHRGRDPLTRHQRKTSIGHLRMKPRPEKKLGKTGFASPVKALKVKQKFIIISLRDITYLTFETKTG